MPGRRGRGYVVQCYFSVTGFDDVPQTAFIPSRSDPPAKGLIGKHAMTPLLQLLSDTQPDETEILLRRDLVARNAVAPRLGVNAAPTAPHQTLPRQRSQAIARQSCRRHYPDTAGRNTK